MCLSNDIYQTFALTISHSTPKFEAILIIDLAKHVQPWQNTRKR
jgi:hypothetical protein